MTDEHKDDDLAPEDQYVVRSIMSPKYAAEVFARILPLLQNPQYRTAFFQRLATHKD
jgi:hypothetical protein